MLSNLTLREEIGRLEVIVSQSNQGSPTKPVLQLESRADPSGAGVKPEDDQAVIARQQALIKELKRKLKEVLAEKGDADRPRDEEE